MSALPERIHRAATLKLDADRKAIRNRQST